jgi:hypothetical protein
MCRAKSTQGQIMIDAIKSLTDTIINFLTEDPVRPHIAHSSRVGDHKDIFVYRNEDNKVMAVTCVSYQSTVPTDESELFELCDNPNIAVFYTIWSYAPGAGRTLIFDAVDYIKQNNTNITRFVTLSPTTQIARKFHLKNNAIIFRENQTSVNYEYV